MSLLIHSMSEFSDIILACLHAARARQVAEIGAEFGGMSQQLAAYAEAMDGKLTSIDPAPQPEFLAWAAHCPSIEHVPATSIDAMPQLADIDAWVIDGDHNYYTVMRELQIADALCRRDDKPLLAILHDVSWPCARRDCYYAPEQIPAEWRHPYSYEAGVTLDDPGTQVDRGFRGCGTFAWALHEGGPRNGVLTAVEDFVGEARSEERQLAWAHVPAVFGLGILFDATAPWAADVAQIVQPYHDNPLLAALELNRLRNYLAVIDWQDRQAA
ncbi:MAG: class I SAM-dependent methyltransferase [Sphingomonas sp.]